MAWPWSHTREAYDNVRDNIRSLPESTLRVIVAEIHTYGKCVKESERDYPSEAFNSEVYQTMLESASSLSKGELEDKVWAFANEWRLCTSGGWNAHLCPYGCGCHMVLFDKDELKESTRR